MHGGVLNGGADGGEFSTELVKRFTGEIASPLGKAAALATITQTAQFAGCVIELMKLFTAISAERSGRITAILPENAQLVEFDQPLFEMEHG
jgi:acetyl/propionyl-CoA carboxylase alpha subunit